MSYGPKLKSHDVRDLVVIGASEILSVADKFTVSSAAVSASSLLKVSDGSREIKGSKSSAVDVRRYTGLFRVA